MSDDARPAAAGEARAPRTPAEAAEEQLVAYNAHDVERFVAAYATDVEAFDLPATVPYLEGRAALRARYAAYFAREPRVRCEVLSRRVQGRFVFDHERLTGYADGRTGSCMAVYEVLDGLIRRVWFAR